jgi:DNA-binding response OmpR family regulator
MPQRPAPLGILPSASLAAPTLRVAVFDRDTGFITVLQKRLEMLEWTHRTLPATAPPESIAPMRLHAIVVDLSVLGFQAWEWLEQVRRSAPELCIVVCTGPSTVAQRVRGLDLGADDWITKPCHPAEVIARVRGVVNRRRQAAGSAPAEPIRTGEVEIRLDRFQAYVQGVSLDLTKREFELIHLLANSEGQVLEREEIFSRVWGFTMGPGDRTVDVYVRKLRIKLGEASPEWRYIHTHFGIGYRFAPESLDIQESA